jgi:hypothetical protein
MSKTWKDRYVVKKYPFIVRRDGKVILDYASDIPGAKKYVKKMTNRSLRRFKGEIASGGAYKKHFYTMWGII